MLSDAIEYYHSLLAGPFLDDAIEKLSETAAKQRLSFGSRPICTVLRPLFITSDQYDYIKRESTLVLTAIEKLGKALMADAKLRTELDLSGQEEEIIAVDPRFSAPDAGGRLDAFFDSRGDFSFIEYNADSHDGMFYGEILGEIFMDMHIVREFGRKFPVQPMAVKPRILETLLDCYREWGNWNSRERPKIAILDWKGVETHTESEICREYFESRGYPAMIAAPDELEYRGGWLRVRDFDINIVYKRVITSDLLKQGGLNHPLVRAARDRAVCVVNSLRAQMLHKKAIFALLDDPAYDHLFSSEEIGALRRHIPWTRRLHQGFTTYQGRRVDLLDFALSHRNRLVIKPNGWPNGGANGRDHERGTTIGRSCTDEEWQRTIRDALEGSFVVQELVEAVRQPFPMLVMGEIECEDRYLDFNPYTWGGEMVEGAGVTLSSSTLLNGSVRGRSAAPALIIEK